jgi:hypothetical protein
VLFRSTPRTETCCGQVDVEPDGTCDGEARHGATLGVGVAVAGTR